MESRNPFEKATVMVSWLVICLSFSTFLLALFGRYGASLGFVDHPRETSAHTSPTVVGAGSVPVLSIVLVLWFGDLLSENPFPEWLILFLIASLAIVGLIDDWLGISPIVRFVLYLIASATLPCHSSGSMEFSWPEICVVSILVAWCINLFNFMDGLDGFATTQAMLVAVGLGLLAHRNLGDPSALSNICIIIVTALIPMLWFNWPPAKMFLGDAGAVPLGFMMALIGMLAFDQSQSLGLSWVVLMMPFLMDATVTLLSRITNGDVWYLPHNDHAYQRLARLYGGALPVCFGLVGMHLLFLFPLAFAILEQPRYQFFLVSISTLPTLFLMVYLRRSG